MTHKELKLLRHKLELNQTQMAEKLGISLATYGLYERGKTMSKTVRLLAETMSAALG
jgi:hypothetical protein